MISAQQEKWQAGQASKPKRSRSSQDHPAQPSKPTTSQNSAARPATASPASSASWPAPAAKTTAARSACMTGGALILAKRISCARAARRYSDQDL